MNAEELEIARRLVACKGWVWLPGMTVTDGGGERGIVRAVFGAGQIDLVTIGRVPEITGEFWPGLDTIPDLDDDLTRLGVLAVVRRAWGDKTASVRAVDCYPLSAMWTWIAGQPGVRRVGHERTELAALLAALEAAP